MRMKSRCSIATVGLVVQAATVWGVTFEVGPGKPHTTIQSAVNAGVALDNPAATNNTPPADPVVIVVYAGVYNEVVTIPAQSPARFNSQNDSWTIRANTGDRVVVVGGISVGVDRDFFVFDGINVEMVGRSGYAFAQTARSCTVRNAFIHGGNVTAAGFPAINLNRLFGTNTFEHLTVWNCTNGITAADNSTFVLRDSIIAGCGGYAVGRFGGNANPISFSNLFNPTNCNTSGTIGDCSGFPDNGGNVNYPAGADPLFLSTSPASPEFLWLSVLSPSAGTASSPGAFTNGQSNMGALPADQDAADLGACCDTIEGTCTRTAAETCGGAFQGPGTSCDTSACTRWVPAVCGIDHGLQGVAFNRFPGNPIIQPSTDVPPNGFWTDNQDTLHQCVARKDQNSPFMMWYTGGSVNDYPRRIHLATSPDGVTFTKVGVVLQPGPPGSFDDAQVHMPTVLWHDNTWKMWYTGHKIQPCSNPCTPEESAGWNTIGYATSPDGVNWTKHGRVLNVDPDLDAFDSDTVREPTVLFDEADGLFKMWYNGTQTGGHFGPTGFAISPDGISWTRMGQVSDTEDRLRGGAIKLGDYFYMFYNVGPRLAWATSRDGITWVDGPGNPILSPQPGWESGYLQAPSLYYDQPTGKLLMYYNAWNGVSEKIGGAWTWFTPIRLPDSFFGDHDLDDDVDMNDHSLMQRCLGQTGLGAMAAGCYQADLNCDLRVDSGDRTIFTGCLSGAEVALDPACRAE